MSAAEEHRTAYEVLGVPRDATAEEVRRAYRRAARAAHPDVGGDPAAFRAVTRAWDLLGDAEARRRYDLSLPGPDVARARDPRDRPCRVVVRSVSCLFISRPARSRVGFCRRQSQLCIR